MGFNYASEKRRFEGEWQLLAEQYRKAGFDEAGIEAMRDFDWKLFKKRRTYENHVQMFPSEVIDNSNEGSNSTLFRKYPSLSASFDVDSFTSRYAWIDDVEDTVLADKLSKLSDSDKELLTLLVFEERTQTEIATMRGCSQVAICKKINRIKKYLA